jgi:hypothetical protein
MMLDIGEYAQLRTLWRMLDASVRGYGPQVTFFKGGWEIGEHRECDDVSLTHGRELGWYGDVDKMVGHFYRDT